MTHRDVGYLIQELRGLDAPAEGDVLKWTNSRPAWETAGGGGLTNINISAGTTSNNLSAFTLSNSNGFSFGLDGSTITGSYTVPTVTNSSWTASDAATSLTIARLAFTNANGMTMTLSTTTGGSVTLVGSYTVPTVTNSSWTVSDAATSGSVARLAFTNQNGVTLSLSTGAGGSHTIVGSHNALTSQSTQFLAITLGGNTAGTTTFHATNNASIFLHGGNNITLSGNASSITISAGAGGAGVGGVGASNTGNTAGNTGTSTGTWVFAGTNNITVSESTGGGGVHTLWFSAPNAAGGAARSYFQWPEENANSSAAQISGSSKHIQPIRIPYDLSVSYIRMPLTLSCVGSNAATGTAANQTVGATISSTFQLAFYSLGTGASSLSLQSYYTTSHSWVQQLSIQAAGVGSNWSSGHTISYPMSSSASAAFTTSAAATSASRTMNSSVISNFTNLRFLDLLMETSFSAGVYWMAFNSSTSLATAVSNWLSTQRILASNVVVSQPAQSINLMGEATNSSNLYHLGLGSWSTNSIGTTTASIQLAAISRSASNLIFNFQMIRQA